LRERAARAEDERELRAEQAKLGERARIAREMHDVLAHKVSLIALHAGALEVNPTADPTTIRETAGLIRTTAREAM
jgi:signal transduction histidine kinase